MIGLSSSFVAPLLVTLCIVDSGWSEYANLDSTALRFIKGMLVMQFIQSVVVLYLACVPIRQDRAPNQGEGFYNRCMPACHYCLALFLFLVTPMVVVIAYIYLLVSGTETGATISYLTFYAILTLLLALQFFISLIDVFERLKLENIAARRNGQVAATKMKESEKKEEAENDEGRDERERINEVVLKLPPYQTDKENNNKRIGKSLRLREDMY